MNELLLELTQFEPNPNFEQRPVFIDPSALVSVSVQADSTMIGLMSGKNYAITETPEELASKINQFIEEQMNKQRDFQEEQFQGNIQGDEIY